MYYKAFTAVGVINTTVADAGLTSLVAEPVKVVAILINSSAQEGNMIEGWIGTDRVLEIYDYCLDSQELTGADTFPISTVKMGRVPVDLEIPAGQIFKIAIRSGGTASNIFGSYEYEKIAS